MTRSLLCIASALLLASPIVAKPLRHPEGVLHFVFPAGGRQGSTVEVELGGLEGVNGATGVLIEGVPGVSVRDVRPVKGGKVAAVRATFVIAADAPAGKRLVRVRGGASGLTNARPFFVGRLPEVMEKEANDTPETAQEITLPAVVNGRIEQTLDVDCYAFRARAGQKIVAA